jgi:nucleoside-diphosphate-sugar epimerase
MNKIIREDCIQIINDNEVEKLRNKSFLITGASGMIGSYISYVLKTLNDLYQMNIHIILVVRNVNKLNEELVNDSNVEIIVQDVVEPFNYNGKIDYIVHAASPAIPKIMKDYPY